MTGVSTVVKKYPGNDPYRIPWATVYTRLQDDMLKHDPFVIRNGTSYMIECVRKYYAIKVELLHLDVDWKIPPAWYLVFETYEDYMTFQLTLPA